MKRKQFRKPFQKKKVRKELVFGEPVIVRCEWCGQHYSVPKGFLMMECEKCPFIIIETVHKPVVVEKIKGRNAVQTEILTAQRSNCGYVMDRYEYRGRGRR